MITADQIVAHMVGDYLLQSHWMATEKTKRSVAAAAHVVTYAIPFYFWFSPSWLALAFVVGTHFAIDRWRLARYVVWAKNWLAPWPKRGERRVHPVPPFSECSGTGYTPDTPPWLAVWLLIIADNTLHVICNGFALTYL